MGKGSITIMTRQELIENIQRKQTFLCVGLDTDIQKIPQHLLKEEDPVFAFNKAIIDATAPYCIAFKPNLAFYEAMGVKGWMAFEKTIRYIREQYPDQFIIADAKRGDIGNTSKLYARTFFEELDVDAVTVAPYMGEDSVTPFLSPLPASPKGEEKSSRQHWVILLALTSNKGSMDFQTQPLANSPHEGEENSSNLRLFEQVILKSQEWEEKALPPTEGAERGAALMYVVGATRGEMFKDIRRIAPNHFLLVPGIGAQGGSLEEVCRYGMTKDCGLIVNSSRAIIYASNGEDFAERAGEEARKVQQQMERQLGIAHRGYREGRGHRED